jgi:Sulfotransferase family
VIVSHQLRLIFVKTRKTASTSVEIALSRYTGRKDIITPVIDQDEALRREEGGHGPQHYRVPWLSLRATDLSEMARTLRRPRILNNHTPASVIIKTVGQHVWDDYTTFTVERNPWDRAVSLYYFMHDKNSREAPSFSQFLKESPPGHLSNFHLYAIDGKIAVDRVVRYEDLLIGLADIWTSVGIRDPVELPHSKGQFRPSATRDYRTMFTDDDAELVARVCQPEIEAYGYSFE